MTYKGNSTSKKKVDGEKFRKNFDEIFQKKNYGLYIDMSTVIFPKCKLCGNSGVIQFVNPQETIYCCDKCYKKKIGE